MTAGCGASAARRNGAATLRKRRVVAGIALALAAAGSPAAGAWTLTAGAGAARSLPMPLSIQQEGFPELELTARYDNRPFDTPPHWVLRISLRSPGGAWEVQHLHHKLYLRNRPPEVERFDVTHGYNVFTVGRAWSRNSFELRAGAGLVIAHPESTVRGRRFGPKQGIFGLDQYLTGPALILGASRVWTLGRRAFLSPELQVSAARAHVPIQDGQATVPNVAVHFLIGLGWKF